MPPPNSLTIAPKVEGKKSRSFGVSVLGIVTADMYWSGGTASSIRPVYLSYAASEQAAKAFTANLRLGRPAILTDHNGHEHPRKLEIMKAAGMRWATQKLPGGVSHVTAYLPQLCAQDPGPLPERIRFLFAPPSWWVTEQAAALKAKMTAEEMCSYAQHGGAREAVLGGFLAMMLDRRTIWPLVKDPLFYAALYRAAQTQGWWRGLGKPRAGVLSYPFTESRLPVGIEALAVVSAEHAEFRDFLSLVTSQFLDSARPAALLEPAHNRADCRPTSGTPVGPRVGQQAPRLVPVAIELAEIDVAPRLTPAAPPTAKPKQFSVFDLL